MVGVVEGLVLINALLFLLDQILHSPLKTILSQHYTTKQRQSPNYILFLFNKNFHLIYIFKFVNIFTKKKNDF